MFKYLSAAITATVLSVGAASAVTLDFDTGTSTFTGGLLTGYSQDGFTFAVTHTGANSNGANLFNTTCGMNPNGQRANCSTAGDDRDLLPFATPGASADGISGNVLIRQERNRNGGNRARSDDAAGIGTITFTLLSGPAFSVLGFSAIDNEVFNISVGGVVLGTISHAAENQTTALVFSTPSTLINVGQSFAVNYFGSGAVDSIALAPIPLPAGGLLLLAGLGGLAIARRRTKAA